MFAWPAYNLSISRGFEETHCTLGLHEVVQIDGVISYSNAAHGGLQQKQLPSECPWWSVTTDGCRHLQTILLTGDARSMCGCLDSGSSDIHGKRQMIELPTHLQDLAMQMKNTNNVSDQFQAS